MDQEQSQAAPEEREEAQFEETLDKRQPRLWITPALVIANVAVWLGTLISASHALSQPEFISLGANFGLRTLNGEPWRLVAYLFLHAGPLHLLFNMIALVDCGRHCERLFGPARFTALYLLSGMTGGLLSAMADPFQVSVGASGAVFGLMGGLLVLMLQPGKDVPQSGLRKRLYSVLVLVAYTAIASNEGEPIDHAAHIAGFLGGGACALFLMPGLRPAFMIPGAAMYLLVATGLMASHQAPSEERMEAWRAEQRYIEDVAWLKVREPELNRLADMSVRKRGSQAELRKVAAGWDEIRDRFSVHAKQRKELDDLLRYAALKAHAYRVLADAPADAKGLPAEYVKTMQELRQMELVAAGVQALRGR